MTKIPPVVDYPNLTDKQLRDLKSRYLSAGFPDYAEKCAAELELRGKAKSSDYAHVKWNQAYVREVMEPFRVVAAAVSGNTRTPYTDAGGTKIGRKKTDPERNWIDTYSGIGKPGLSAAFVCYVKSPGNDPSFELQVNGETVSTFAADDLPVALDRWKHMAASSAA